MASQDEDLTPEGFRRADGEFILIAGSSDVADRRPAVEGAIRQALQAGGHGGEIVTYSWELELGPEGFDQRRSMQRNLWRPSDDNCRGVVCLIGERIGLPLEDEFACHWIANVKEWTAPGHRYRLHHPWPDDPAERRRLVEDGAYPLTGTVFEFLDGLGAGKPVWLGLLADREIRVDGEDVLLNGNQYLMKRTGAMLPKDIGPWHEGEYFEHYTAVHNFMRALSKRGRDQHPSRDSEKIRAATRAFVEKAVLGTGSDRSNPYKYLTYFDIHDGQDFHGRREFVNRTIGDLEARFEDSRPAVVRIVGPSGCGKSSVLRAGILDTLLERRRREHYACLAVRPEDFQDASGEALPVIRTLLDLIVERTSLRLAHRDIVEVVRKGAAAPTAAVGLLSRELAAASQRLVIGIDQFEEILDTLADRVQANHWQPLITFINAAVDTPTIGIVYTLESSRKEAHQRERLGPAFEGSIVKPLDDLSETFLETIIDLPFRRAGFPLSRDAVAGLIGNLNRLRPDDDPSAHDAVLPLLALKLSHLFDDVKDRFEPQSAGDTLAFSSATGIDDKGIPAGSLDLGFDTIIKTQAERAWRRGGQTLPVDIQQLENFLQPLIGISNDRIQLYAIPRLRPYPDEVKLTESFLHQRLLVLVGSERVRLVHEAAVRRWPAADAWYEKRAPYLSMEGRMRMEAAAWDARGRPEISSDLPEERIDEATEILNSYLRAWAWKGMTLTDQDTLLRDYCCEIFCQSTWPHRLTFGIGDTKKEHCHLASAYGLTKLIKIFQSIDDTCLNHPNPHAKTARSPLYHAVWAQEDTVAYLLEHGADPFEKDADGWPAIAAAIQRDEMGIFGRMLTKAHEIHPGCDLEPELACPNGQTLLHICARFDRVAMARILITNHGFDSKATDANNWQPLHAAAAGGAVGAFGFFAKDTPLSETVNGGPTCLHLAAANGQTSLVEHILAGRGGSSVTTITDERGNSALHYAASQQHANCVRALVPHLNPNQPNRFGDRPIHLSIPQLPFQGSPEQLPDEEDVIDTLSALLADRRTDPNVKDAQGRTAIALADKFPKVRKLLLRDERLRLTEPTKTEGEPAYVLAARLGLWDVVRRHVEESGPPTDPDLDGQGNSFLHLLTFKKSPSDFLDLALKGADDKALNARNKKGETPIRQAIAAGNWPVVDRLFATGRLDLARGPSEPFGLLLHALQHGVDGVWLARIVEAFPAALEERDIAGWTALHHACGHQAQDWVDALKPFAADIPKVWADTDRCGRRPIDLLHPDRRAETLESLRGQPWPAAKSWDSGLIWVDIAGDQRAALIERIGEVDDKYAVGATTAIHQSRLTFYGDAVTLLRLRDPAWQQANLALYYLEFEEQLYRLKGTSPPIHELNAKSGKGQRTLCLTQDNALDYLRFFCFFVRGEEGPFLIVESPTQCEIPDDLSEQDRSVIARFAHPAWLQGWVDEQNAFYAAATVYYGNAVFAAWFKIQSGGMVEMLDDRPVAADLRARVDQPVA